MSINRGILAFALIFAAGVASAAPLGTGLARVRTGVASWYGPRFEGHLTASGCRFDPSKLSAASPTIPIGAWVRVHRPHSQLAVVVPITDRGPYVPGRIIDLSEAAAEKLDMIAAGIVLVELERLDLKPVRGCLHAD